MTRRYAIAVALVAVVAVGCAGAAPAAIWPRVDTHTGAIVWPRHVNIVGRIRATMPADDDTTKFSPLYRTAARIACPNAPSVESGTRFLSPRRWLILTRCGRLSHEQVPGVLVTFVDVRVPKMIGLAFPQPQGVTDRLGLRLRIVRGRRGRGPVRFVAQRPRAGTVVAFGTTVVVTRG